jgi:hypothetical protein
VPLYGTTIFSIRLAAPTDVFGSVWRPANKLHSWGRVHLVEMKTEVVKETFRRT